MIWLWLFTRCCRFRIRLFGINMTPMWHDRILYFSYMWFSFSRDLLFWAFCIWFLIYLMTDHAMIVMEILYFWKIYNIHNKKWPCIVVTFFFRGNSELNLESLIMILFSASLAFLIPPSAGSLTRMLWGSRTETHSNNFGTICGLLWTPMFTFRKSLKIGYCTTCGWCIIQFWRHFFIW